MSIAQKFKEGAAELGLCGKWMEEWEPKDDVADMASRYVDGISFCLLHDFPALDELREAYRLDTKVCNDKGLYIDENVDLLVADSRDFVFRGKCTGKVVFRGVGIAYVYIMDYCDLEIESSGFFSVFVKTVGDLSACRAKKSGYGNIKVRKFRKEDIE